MSAVVPQAAAELYDVVALVDRSGAVDQTAPSRFRYRTASVVELVDGIVADTEVGEERGRLRFMAVGGASQNVWQGAGELESSYPFPTRLPRAVRVTVAAAQGGGGGGGGGGSGVAKEVQLALPWRKYGHISFGTGEDSDMTIDGRRIIIGVDDGAGNSGGDAPAAETEDEAGAAAAPDGEPDAPPPKPHGATGLTLWDGAVLLSKFMEAHRDEVCTVCRVPETSSTDDSSLANSKPRL